MEIDEFSELDDFDDFNEGLENEGLENQQPELEESNDDLTSEVLRLKGINDASKIKFEDDNGAIIERSWDSLSKDEQLNILTDNGPKGHQLYDDEIELLNTIRGANMTPQQYLQALSTPATPQRYEVDDMSDDELYALDLMNRVGTDVSDEEIIQQIEAAKANPTFYQKTIDSLREEYIQREQEIENSRIAEQNAAYQQQYQQFSNNIVNSINNLDSFAGQSLELSNDDKDQLASFILDFDENGVSTFSKCLNNPELFTKAAFWILNEDEITAEITRQIQENYKRGYEAAKRDLSGQSSFTFKPKKTSGQNSQEEFIEDEDW